MAYPSNITDFVIKINKNASGYQITNEYFNVPGALPYELYLDHVPKDSASTAVGASGGAAWTQVFVAPTSADHYLVDYTTGKVTFHSGNANNAAYATYKTLGDDVMAEHINVLQDDLHGVEAELGTNVKAGYDSVASRLNALAASSSASGINGQLITDGTVRPGALTDEVKGASWVSVGRPTLQSIGDHRDQAIGAHAASAISATPPGTATFVSVQGHIDAKGVGTVTNSNPHGMTVADLEGALSGDTYINGRLVVTGNAAEASYFMASGNYMYLNWQGLHADSAIFFYDTASPVGQRLCWNDNGSNFELSTDTMVQGTITASGNIQGPNILAEASGAGSVGLTVAPFLAMNAQTMRADEGYFTTLFGDGSNLTGVVSNHSALTGKNWAVAGHTIDANIVPTASGNQNVGTNGVAFNEVNAKTGRFDTIYATEIYTSGATIYVGGQTLNNYIGTQAAKSAKYA